MTDSVISVENLSKRYVIGHESRHDNLRDTLHHTARKLWRRFRWGTGFRTEEFWALRDVSFEVKPGEVVGIIGRNGAGKSTLLKILSRITEPTAGRVTIRGRVASLLEVGTGFHGELSGRENVFLNGAILGMKRAEIRRKFDEIVAFAEVEKFLDTPVKYYSSGMYVRLAFAVAAHLEPEILIVDEVLAVGDIAFQKKCLGKMQAVSRDEGRTVLFVSHSLQSVRNLCSSGLLLASGKVCATGPINKVLEIYQRGLTDATPTAVPKPSPDLLDRAYVTGVAIETVDGRLARTLPAGQPWRVRVQVHIERLQRNFVIALGIRSGDGTSIQTVWLPPRELPRGDYETVFTQDRVILEAGTYSLLVGISEDSRDLQQFEVACLDITGENAVGYFPATSGVGAVLNSMTIAIARTP
jgi:lipopolysaccharide transport system ATP-binding protein